ncbi:tyrosine--tRNA ligase [Candidatus Saccharibacteria bacterium]|nr:tyrosine--tRNA ligase [Candidatus Saccharibacteria bacterium]
MTLSEELTWRGFANQWTYKSITDIDINKFTFYWGVDPSADSMTIGNLAAAMMVRHFIDHGQKAILLLGGATGMIGDPDGKSAERELLSTEQIAANKSAIAEQYKRVFAGKDFEIVDNYEWFKDISYLDFLRDVGKHVPMRTMLGREFVQSRLGEEGSGISYAEFSYSLIQGYDFLHLNREKGVSLQVCGADQWGNSIAGVDLIRRLTGNEAHVWSAPLIVNKDTGVKFGKSEEGAVWLDANKTSAYKFYQFWLNVGDESAGDLLKIYTLLPKDEIESILVSHQHEPGKRIAQITLADQVTSLVHGTEAMAVAKFATEVTFQNRRLDSVSEEEITTLMKELPSAHVNLKELERLTVTDIVVLLGLASSKREAREFIASGAIRINNEPVEANADLFPVAKLQAGAGLIRRGQKQFGIIKAA